MLIALVATFPNWLRGLYSYYLMGIGITTKIITTTTNFTLSVLVVLIGFIPLETLQCLIGIFVMWVLESSFS